MLLLNCIAVMNMYFLPNNDVCFSCTLGKLTFQKVWFLKQKKYFTLSMVLKERQRPYKKNTIETNYYISLKKENFP